MPLSAHIDHTHVQLDDYGMLYTHVIKIIGNICSENMVNVKNLEIYRNSNSMGGKI